MGLTKLQKHKNSLIQKEQQQLLKIQKELVNALVKVNEAINVLKVEELQLKSSTAVFDHQTYTDKISNKQHDFERTPSDLNLNPSVSQRSSSETKGNMHLNLNISKREDIEEFEDDDDEI